MLSPGPIGLDSSKVKAFAWQALRKAALAAATAAGTELGKAFIARLLGKGDDDDDEDEPPEEPERKS